jgi:Cof subfamily protein (haloacid dehalogenase superfamily)
VAIGLILIDVDGTLVGPGLVVPESAWEAIERAQQKGVHVAICTGRPCYGLAVTYARRISAKAFHVFHSGAVLCTADGGLLDVIALPPESYRRQVQLGRSNNASMEAYTVSETFVESHSEWTLGHARLIGLETVVVDDLLEIASPLVRVQWVLPWDRWPLFEAASLADGALEVSVATQPDMPEACFSSITAKGISKGSAAQTLAAHHGLTMDEVAMIGDGDNDLEVFAVVGLPIAMGNGSARARSAAKHVVAPVDQNGLAEAIDLALTH